ncbi:restriction endonuclease subunit S [Brachyspira aalborgi]|uniref:restriction endonuclease subunit S n=1 Tax=Brachyspira aalborgi TaxID=29522 RepID=UPI0011C9C567|nr:restriction endonuclease subunit S [Brachyspira aalborgi]TXJ50925.1 restriction endonuclease subunit S [Brachyspira aalborgi]
MNKLPAGWEIKKLKDICTIQDGIHKTPKYTSKGIKFVSVENINDLYNSNKFISEEDYNKMYKIKAKKNDIFMTRIGDIGTPAILNKDEKLAYYVTLCLFTNIDEEVFNKYLYYAIQSNYFKKELYHRTLHVAFPKKINLGDIGDCKFILPTLDEQKRIASALSKIDAYLENTIKLIEEKERFKRGIAKKLLTCKEGENIPEARFKGFEDEWEIVKLGDICLINNKILKENTDKDYKFKYIDLTAVKKGIINFSNDYTTFENAPISARRIINKNDIIMATVRPYLLGHAFIDFEAKDYICSKGFAVLTANSNIEMKYIYQYLYSDDMAKQIKSRLVGSTYPTIRLSDIKELKIKIPKSIKEQEKIGGYLSLLDEEIDNLKKQKELINEMKKGAMQKLLSGEIRLLE